MKRTIYFRLWGITCFAIFLTAGRASAQQQQWNPGFSIGTASGQYDFSAAQAPGELSVLLAAAIPNTTGVSYQWYSSPYPTTDFTPIPGATGTTYTVSSPLTATMYYKLMATASGLGTDSSNTIQINLVSGNWEDINYLRVHDVLTTGITTWQQVDELPIGQKLQTTTYLDGLGRTLEHVSRGTATPPSGSSTWGDMVSFAEYDSLGRQPLHYLPYTTDTLAGKYKPTPLSQQPEYYGSVYNETSAFTNTTYDNSPLNRVVNVKEPGASWAAAAGDGASYDMNTAADSVQEFGVDYIQGDAPVHLGAYAPNTLYKLTTTDENGKAVVSYTDMSGRLILKKIQVSNTPSTGHAGWICVYNVYDDFGLLRDRIQPDGVNYLDANGWSFAGTAGTQIPNEQCFQYNYDDKGRVIWKKAPGQGPEQIIYDIRDRVVFTQDSDQAAPPDPPQGGMTRWTVHLYDDLDRPVMTALYYTSETRAQLQADVNNSVSMSSVTVNNPGGAITNLVVDNRNTAITTYQARNSITFVADAGGSFSTQPGDNFVAEINPNAVDSTTTTTVAVFNNPISQANLNDTSVTTILKYQYYDNYAFTNARPFSTNFDNTNAYSAGGNVMPIAVSERTLGFPTGSMVRVLGTNTFLNNTDYYDEKGRLIQTQRDNILQGQDISTYQYHFDGRLLSMDRKHSTAHTGYDNFDVLTRYDYDLIGRVDSIQKEIGGATWKTLASYTYDDMGRLKTKILDPDYPPPSGSPAGGGLESQSYSYNIHNQITGINKDYALKTPGVYSQWNHYFGEYLGYDNKDHVFNAAQLDGQVTGQLWNTQGDAVQRRYDYTYDDADRLSGAGFLQNSSGTWKNDSVNFSVSNLNYDANGNILTVNRDGLKVNQSSPIDELTYSYETNSNKLQQVTDAANDPNSTLGDFHYSGTKTGTDYTYDGNGNLTSDANKQISAITYNYLNLPESIVFTGKGSIAYVYDADGNKLEKVVTDQTVTPNKITTTNYCDGFVYNSDTLLYMLTGEGRIRPDSSSGLPAGGFTYDYFLRDHLGDVRAVITEQTSENTYAATMENKNASVENQLFDNVSSTQYPTPPGFNNPIDTSNHYVSMLDGSDGNNTLPRVGPAIVLKVMAGDTITIATQAWYSGAVEPPPSGANNLLNDLLNALTGGVITNSHGLYGTSDNNPNTVLSGDLGQFFTNDENSNYNTSAPKAYLNWVAFDDQLNMNSANSGVVQVPQIAAGAQEQPLVAPEQIIQKNGYLYIYVSNESAQKVFFDNLVIHHNKGHLLEEDQYYPFGLQMAGISDKALPVVPNNYLYNGKELQQNEFNDGTSLDDYDYGFRGYDPQIARFTEQDPLTDEFATVSPYQYALNDPVANIDKDGLASVPLGEVTITAKAIHRMSAFSSFTSRLLGEAGLASEAINLSSLGVHVLQTGGVLGLSWLTRSIGMRAASNLGGGPEDWYLKNNTNQISWINGSGARAGYNDLGKNLKFIFTSYIDKTYNGPHIWSVEGNKLTSIINVTSDEDANGNLLSVSVKSSPPIIGETDNIPIFKGRNYFPGLGSKQNESIDISNSRKFSTEYVQHASVPRFEAWGLHLLGYDIPDVAQKLELRLSGNVLHIAASTDIFPSATLKVNGITLFHYEQPSFIGTFGEDPSFEDTSPSGVQMIPRAPKPQFYVRYSK
jgi:RHS repeat-associated protein